MKILTPRGRLVAEFVDDGWVFYEEEIERRYQEGVEVFGFVGEIVAEGRDLAETIGREEVGEGDPRFAYALAGDDYRVSFSNNGDVRKAEASGVMIALYPDERSAEVLAEHAEEGAEELHLTLVYIGDDAPPRLEDVVRGFAASTPPIAGKVDGIGRFEVGAVYAHFDSTDLGTYRARLVQALEDAGIEYARDHGFTPHITLAYEGEVEEFDVPNITLTFDRVWVVRGDDRQAFELVGIATKGGKGSGHHGHGGRPGRRGGSAGRRTDPAAAYASASSEAKEWAQMTGVLALDDAALEYVKGANLWRQVTNPEDMVAIRSVDAASWQTELNATARGDDYSYKLNVHQAFALHPPQRIADAYQAHVDAGGGEVAGLLHGTDAGSAQRIGMRGFQLGEKGVDMMGRGVYLAEDTSQAAQYLGRGFAPTASTRRGAMVVSSVSKGSSAEWKVGTKIQATDYDTLHARKGRQGEYYVSDNEWVVKDATRILPTHWLVVTRSEGVQKGGEGSGHHGHAGRPGKRGGSSAIAGHVSRTHAMEQLGVKHAARMNQYFKYGMPSVKLHGRRYVKWPEAKEWYDEYVGAGKGKKGVEAANRKLTGRRMETHVEKPPSPAGGERTMPYEGRQLGTGPLHSEDVSGTFGYGLPRSSVAARNVEKVLQRLPKEHVECVGDIELYSDWRNNPLGKDNKVAGYHIGGGAQGKSVLGLNGEALGELTFQSQRRTLTHEVGHAVHRALVPSEWGPSRAVYDKLVSRGDAIAPGSTASGRVRTLQKRIRGMWLEASQGKRRSITGYARTNHKEYFAEAYEEYVHNPSKLRRIDSELFYLMKTEVFGGLDYTGS